MNTLLVLCMAAMPLANAAQGVEVRAAAPPAIDGATPTSPIPPNTLVQTREQLSRLTQPLDNATQALQIGFLKLKRVCEYGLHEKTASGAVEAYATLIGDRPREELAAVQQALEKIQAEYRQTSRISKNASCRYAPALQFFSAACRGFYEDSDRLNMADQAAQRLIAQTQERLKLYGQYELLERQGCSRAGFTLKLWANEEKNLWPILMGSPAAFKSVLPSPNEN